jgi:arylsulfatase A-like enzyme
MIIISADHGSVYGDIQTRHYAQHSSSVEGVFNIPLIVKYPHSKFRGTENNNLCQTIDIPYTILSELGIDIPSNWKGESLLNLKKKYVVMECNPNNKMWGIKTKDWLCQYVTPEFYNNDAPQVKYIIESIFPFLFNINNPTVNVYNKYPDIVEQMKSLI